MKRGSIKYGVCLVLVYNLTAASPQREPDVQESDDLTAVEMSLSKRLSTTQNAAMVRTQLSSDRRTIEKTAPEMMGTLRRSGYSEKDASSAVAWGWFWLRLGPHAVPLPNELPTTVVQAKLDDLGKLIVNSQPDKAAIFVDDVEWPDPTNHEGFVEVGERSVRVSESGLEPARATCEVARNRTTNFRAFLRVKGSKAECK